MVVDGVGSCRPYLEDCVRLGQCSNLLCDNVCISLFNVAHFVILPRAREERDKDAFVCKIRRRLDWTREVEYGRIRVTVLTDTTARPCAAGNEEGKSGAEQQDKILQMDYLSKIINDSLYKEKSQPPREHYG